MATNEPFKSLQEQSTNETFEEAPGLEAAQRATIASLNDRLRQTGTGGITQITAGIAGLGAAQLARILAAVARFDRFTEDNDPWGEHDCALVKVDGLTILWKIDYYDQSRRFLSANPADPERTVRVLTVMRADEY